MPVNLVSAFKTSKLAPMLAAVSLTVKPVTVVSACSEAASAAVPTVPVGVEPPGAGVVVLRPFETCLAILSLPKPMRFVGGRRARRYHVFANCHALARNYLMVRYRNGKILCRIV